MCCPPMVAEGAEVDAWDYYHCSLCSRADLPEMGPAPPCTCYAHLFFFDSHQKSTLSLNREQADLLSGKAPMFTQADPPRPHDDLFVFYAATSKDLVAWLVYDQIMNTCRLPLWQHQLQLIISADYFRINIDRLICDLQQQLFGLKIDPTHISDLHLGIERMLNSQDIDRTIIKYFIYLYLDNYAETHETTHSAELNRLILAARRTFSSC